MGKEGEDWLNDAAARLDAQEAERRAAARRLNSTSTGAPSSYLLFPTTYVPGDLKKAREPFEREEREKAELKAEVVRVLGKTPESMFDAVNAKYWRRRGSIETEEAEGKAYTARLVLPFTSFSQDYSLYEEEVPGSADHPDSTLTFRFPDPHPKIDHTSFILSAHRVPGDGVNSMFLFKVGFGVERSSVKTTSLGVTNPSGFEITSSLAKIYDSMERPRKTASEMRERIEEEIVMGWRHQQKDGGIYLPWNIERTYKQKMEAFRNRLT